MKTTRASVLWSIGVLAVVMLVLAACTQSVAPTPAPEAKKEAAAAKAPAAKEKVIVGKSVANAFTFTPMEVGVEAGIWEKNGLEVEILVFGGDAKMQQALVSSSIEFGLGSGPGLGFMAKGVPAKGVAAFAGPPRNMALILPMDSTIKDVKDLKGKKIGITTPGSLTDWLVRELGRQQGWGAEGITRVPLGALQENLAALKTKQVDGILQATETGYLLESKGEGKTFLNFGDYVKDFHTHIIFARNDVIQNKPDMVRKFLRGWFDTIAYMRANKPQTVKVSAKTLEIDESVISKAYDSQMPMMSDDGAFNPAAVEMLKKSFVELGILDKEPDSKSMFTTDFVPVKR